MAVFLDIEPASVPDEEVEVVESYHLHVHLYDAAGDYLTTLCGGETMFFWPGSAEQDEARACAATFRYEVVELREGEPPSSLWAGAFPAHPMPFGGVTWPLF